MAAGIMTNFLVQAPTPAYFPFIFQHSPRKEDLEETLIKKPEMRDDIEEGEVDEEEEQEEDEESEALEEEEESVEEVFLSPAHCTLDVTKQLLRFADLISRDVQRYFGRCSGDQEACDIYSDSVSVTTSGRLRYYDDLLKIARAGSPEEQENGSVTFVEDQAVGSLGPLAELFNHKGQSQGHGRPMIKRHLPLSFWTEPMPCCSALVGFSDAEDVTHSHRDTASQESTHTDHDTHMHYSSHTHAFDSTQPDFSDLLANWDPNPEECLSVNISTTEFSLLASPLKAGENVEDLRGEGVVRLLLQPWETREVAVVFSPSGYKPSTTILIISREPEGRRAPNQYSNFNPFGPHMNLDIWNSSSNRSSNSQLSNDSGYCGDV